LTPFSATSTFHVIDVLDLALRIHVAQTKRRERDHVGALHGVGDHGLDRLRHFRVGHRLGEMLFRPEQEMQRHHAGLRRQGRGIRGGGNAELDVAGFHQLQHLRLLAKLGTGILIDQHGALAQLLELVAENIADDAVARRLRLIVGEAIMFDFLRAGACREHNRRCDDRRIDERLQTSHGVPLPG
jgi:hypothetical protein